MTDPHPRRSARVAAVIGALAPALVVAGAAPAAAHGVGERGDLPLPLWQVAWGAALAVGISFAALGALWHRPLLAERAAGRPVPAAVRRALRALGPPVRALVLAVTALAIWAAFTGPTNPNRNLAPVTFYVTLWVGGQLGSAALGDVWPRISPIDTVVLLVDRVRGRRTDLADPDPDDEVASPSHWPAAVGVFAFLWMELAYHDNGNPRFVGSAMLAVAVVLVIGGIRHGRRWLRDADPLGALFGLLAAMAPLARADDGSLRLRLPFVGLTRVRPREGTTALVLVTLAGTTFDGITRTKLWAGFTADHGPWAVTALHTLGLVWLIGCIAVLYVGAVRASARTTGEDPAAVADRYVHSLLPIALAYAVAHYFSLAVFEGQHWLILLSDPAGRGWDLLGTASWRVDYRLIAPSTIALVQAGAIVVGHVLGVLIAHDRAVEHHDARTAIRSQYPLLAVMIAYTVGGLVLLLNA